MDFGRIGLRHIHENAHQLNLGDTEYFVGGAAVSGIDERPHINISRGDNAVKRRRDVSEGFQVFQAPHVGSVRFHSFFCGVEVRLRGFEVGLARVRCGLALVRLLL